jgi:hypothetical protein
MTMMPSYGGSRPSPTILLRPMGRLIVEGWTDLGSNATIAMTNQPPVSRAIVQLQPFRHHVFLGYGEWDVGLDYCDVIAWNTSTALYETVIADVATDAFWVMRVVNDELWALVTDPSVGTDPDAVVFDGANARIVSSGHVTPWHLFDITAWAGAIYLAGANRMSNESHGAVWRSTDGGETWMLVLDLPENQRMHGLFAIEDILYVAGLSGQLWQTRDGTNWAPSSVGLVSGTPCIRPSVVANQAVYLSGWAVFGAQTLYAFDGRHTASIAPEWEVYDAFNDEESLVILTGDRQVKRTRDLVGWETVATGAPQSARSLCVLDEAIYVGTADSRLWRWSW